MRSTFQSLLWQVSVPRPWHAQKCEHCAEFTQPEGAGALHISGALKQHGDVSDDETRAELQKDCPQDTEFERARFGDFSGYGAEYVDWNDSRYWKKWFVRSGRVLLFITYNCKPGDEELEMAQVCQILSSLECRDDDA
jgi:hypothetical protein